MFLQRRPFSITQAGPQLPPELHRMPPPAPPEEALPSSHHVTARRGTNTHYIRKVFTAARIGTRPAGGPRGAPSPPPRAPPRPAPPRGWAGAAPGSAPNPPSSPPLPRTRPSCDPRLDAALVYKLLPAPRMRARPHSFRTA